MWLSFFCLKVMAHVSQFLNPEKHGHIRNLRQASPPKRKKLWKMLFRAPYLEFRIGLKGRKKKSHSHYEGKGDREQREFVNPKA